MSDFGMRSAMRQAPNKAVAVKENGEPAGSFGIFHPPIETKHNSPNANCEGSVASVAYLPARRDSLAFYPFLLW